MADFITPKQSGMAAWMVKHGKKAMINPTNGNLVINRMTGITSTEKIKGMSTPTKGWWETELDMRKVFELDTGVTKTAYQAQQQGWYVISLDTEQYMSKNGKTWIKGEVPGVAGYPFYYAGRIKNTWYLFATAASSTVVEISKSNDFKTWNAYSSQFSVTMTGAIVSIAQNDSVICLAGYGSTSYSPPNYITVISTFQGDTEIKRQFVESEAMAAVIAATSFGYDYAFSLPVAIAWNGKTFCCIVVAETWKGMIVAQCTGYFAYTSTDGISWQFNPTPIIPIANYFTPFSGPMSAIMYIEATKGLFCLIGYNAGSTSWFDSYTSKDGKTWSGPFTISHGDISVVNGANDLTASKNTFCILADAISGVPSGIQTRVMTSTDGKAWQASALFGDGSGATIGSNGDSFVANAPYGGYSRFYYSKTGMNWELLPLTAINQGYNINSYFSRR